MKLELTNRVAAGWVIATCALPKVGRPGRIFELPVLSCTINREQEGGVSGWMQTTEDEENEYTYKCR